MTEELKACSVCGSNNIKSDYNIYAECLDCGAEMTVETWQSRPLEDVLRAKLDMARDVIHRITTYDCGFIVNNIVTELLKKLDE